MESEARTTREQRWASRVVIRQPVTVRWEDHDRTGTLHHISVSGCFVEIAFPYPVDATLTLSFLIDSGNSSMVIDGKVVMRNLGGIGIRFVHRDTDKALTLKRWIDAHASARPLSHRAA